jgi:hypothetical protein
MKRASFFILAASIAAVARAAPPELTPDPARQEQPAVVWTGTHYFVAWVDTPDRYKFGTEIRAARIMPDGRNLDPHPIRLTTSPESRGRLQLSWNGQDVLAAWSEFTGPDFAIRMTRVRPDGAVRDPDGILVTSTGGEGLGALSWDGSRHLLAWNTSSSQANQILMAQISTDAALMGPPAVVSSSPMVKTQLAMDASGGKALLAWSQSPLDMSSPARLFGARLMNGKVEATDWPLVQADGAQSSPTVGWNGAGYLVTYQSGEPGYAQHGLRVAADGTIQTPGGFPLSTDADGYVGFPLRQALTGSQHLLVVPGSTTLATGLMGGRLATTGTAPATGFPHLITVPRNTAFGDVALASDGTRALAVWAQKLPDAPDWDVVALRIDENGRAADATSTPVAFVAPNGGVPDAARDASADVNLDLAPAADGATATASTGCDCDAGGRAGRGQAIVSLPLLLALTRTARRRPRRGGTSRSRSRA